MGCSKHETVTLVGCVWCDNEELEEEVERLREALEDAISDLRLVEKFLDDENYTEPKEHISKVIKKHEQALNQEKVE